jgi:hypothetical protein
VQPAVALVAAPERIAPISLGTFAVDSATSCDGQRAKKNSETKTETRQHGNPFLER